MTAGYTLRPAPLDIVADCKAVITALTARVHIAINLLSYRTVSESCFLHSLAPELNVYCQLKHVDTARHTTSGQMLGETCKLGLAALDLQAVQALGDFAGSRSICVNGLMSLMQRSFTFGHDECANLCRRTPCMWTPSTSCAAAR